MYTQIYKVNKSLKIKTAMNSRCRIVMNIHITEKHHKYLQQFVRQTEVIGSHLYGTNSENSDKDLLCIIEINDNDIKNYLSRLPSYHQWQYRDVEQNIDYIYTTKYNFFYNQASGDSTINSDILLFRNAPKSKYLIDFCYTYKVIKGYLGFAKRDLKQSNEGNHKLIHTKRGLYCAEKLMNHELPLLSDIKEFYNSNIDWNELVHLEADLRVELTKMLETGKIKHYYVPQIFDEDEDEYVFQMLLDSNNTTEFKY